MVRRRALLRLLATIMMAGLVATLGATAPAAADGPPGPGPYSKILLGAGPAVVTCYDADGTLLYRDAAWTLEPLVRGPLFAPVVLWLSGRDNVPVLPLEFTSTAYPMMWDTVDSGPAESGLIESLHGRPAGYGSVPTDTAPRVTCGYDHFGWFQFGEYILTAGLAEALGLPGRLVGRTLRFEGEGSVRFSVPRYLFPLTAGVVVPTLKTPDYLRYGKRALPTVTCGRDGRLVYRGAAYTLAPLVRGYRWAPMAFWISGDRIVIPRWALSRVTGTWQTVSGTPARSGRLDATYAGRPTGYGGRPLNPTAGVECGWSGTHATTTVVSPALAYQLDLPAEVIGRQVSLSGAYTIQAFSPNWLFPPA
ncbi:MAG TPA: hypothetical protein VFM55_13335 [Micromonosporaceae bacterium]|nr:hypothetical protein [Micromonosporaceae bacterium]